MPYGRVVASRPRTDDPVLTKADLVFASGPDRDLSFVPDTCDMRVVQNGKFCTIWLSLYNGAVHEDNDGFLWVKLPGGLAVEVTPVTEFGVKLVSPLVYTETGGVLAVYWDVGGQAQGWILTKRTDDLPFDHTKLWTIEGCVSFVSMGQVIL